MKNTSEWIEYKPNPYWVGIVDMYGNYKAIRIDPSKKNSKNKGDKS